MTATRTLLTVGLLALAIGGCQRQYQVRPTELPKLASAQTQTFVGTAWTSGGVIPVGGQQDVPVKLITATGGVASVGGGASVEIRSRGMVYAFTPPLLPEVDGDTLIMRDALGEERFPLADVDGAIVTQTDSTATLLGVSAFTSLVGAVVLFIALP